jgi:hypothetical protein
MARASTSVIHHACIENRLLGEALTEQNPQTNASR